MLKKKTQITPDPESGVALLIVTLLLFVLIIVITEIVSSSRIRVLTSENLTDQHMSHYAIETAMLEAEEILYQDVNPPPRREDLEFTPEETDYDNRQKKSDSYHDYWAKNDFIKASGESWIKSVIRDEEGKFNVNSLIHPKTKLVMPLQKGLFKDILHEMGLRDLEITEMVDEFVDYIDKNKKDDSANPGHNAPIRNLRECLLFESVSEEFYLGHHFPSGELPLRVIDDSLDFEDDTTFEDEQAEDLENEKEKEKKNPYTKREIPPISEWEDVKIIPGLKDLLTVYGNGKINLNTAPLPVLVAIFGELEIAIEVMKERIKTPFSDFEQIRKIPNALNGVSKYASILGFRSEFFRINMDIRHRRIRERRSVITRRWKGKVMSLYRSRDI